MAPQERPSPTGGTSGMLHTRAIHGLTLPTPGTYSPRKPHSRLPSRRCVSHPALGCHSPDEALQDAGNPSGFRSRLEARFLERFPVPDPRSTIGTTMVDRDHVVRSDPTSRQMFNLDGRTWNPEFHLREHANQIASSHPATANLLHHRANRVATHPDDIYFRTR